MVNPQQRTPAKNQPTGAPSSRTGPGRFPQRQPDAAAQRSGTPTQARSHGVQVGASEAACPSCNQIDRVQSVSVVYRDGRQVTELRLNHYDAGGYPSRISGRATTITPLARALTPPRQPRTLTMPIVVFATTAFLQWWLLVTDAQDGAASQSGALQFLIFGLVVELACGLVIWRRRIRQITQGPVAGRALDLWRRAWYCGRCGVAYLPGSRAVPAAQLTRALLRRAEWEVNAATSGV
jgi:hypothetical protein